MTTEGRPVPTWLPPDVYQDKAFAEKYLIECDLGRGAGGVVVGARHRELDERVAIKFLWPGPQSSEAALRFRREARAANRIKNEHVVQIKDFGTTEAGVPYIVMEYLEGIDLERMLQQTRNRQLPIPDAIEFLLQASEALAECHADGIVHRDLKPSNLFCVHGADGLPMIKVLDFGISKLGPANLDTAATDPCRVLGSPRYMSPEQVDSSTNVDNRTDIWAIGVILYELIAGEAPFVDDGLLRLWEKIRTSTPRPLQELRPDCPMALVPVVLKCLEKDRGLRPANLAELAKALMPFGPPRSRASVARIVRTVESPGSTTGALSLPPARDIPPSQAPTTRSISGVRPRPRSRTPILAAALFVGGVVALVLVRRPTITAPNLEDSARNLPPRERAADPSWARELTTSVTAPTLEAPLSVVAISSVPVAPAIVPRVVHPKSKEAVSEPRANALLVAALPAAAEIDAGVPSSTPAASTEPPSHPWIVDIVEKRKSSK